MFDILIKNGLVVDGTGEKGYAANVAIKDGVIVEIKAPWTVPAKQVIDARAAPAVALGLVNCTQLRRSTPVGRRGQAGDRAWRGPHRAGRCSLSLAPLRVADRPAVVGMFQQIEEMPPETFTIAFDWTWEDFAGYRKAIEQLQIDVLRRWSATRRSAPGGGDGHAGSRRAP